MSKPETSSEFVHLGMKKMWLLFFGLVTASAYIGRAQPFRLHESDAYAPLMQQGRLLIIYDKETPADEIRSIISRCELLQERQIASPLFPGRWLVTKKPEAGFEEVINTLQKNARITVVTPWLKDESGTERGILPELYVKPKAGESPDFLLRTAQDFGLRFQGEDSRLEGVYKLICDKNAAYNAWEMALWLKNHPQVESADINWAFFPIVTSVNDSLFNRQWALQNTGGALQWNGTAGADMEVPAAWNLTTGDPSVKIAILDSGVDTLHPDLTPNLLPGFDATGMGSGGYPNLNFPSDGHGTACAGIAAAKGNNQMGVAGVAYDCKIIPVKLFIYIDTVLYIPGFVDTSLFEIPYSETDFMVSAINWASQTAGADVLSNSWGIPPDLMPIAPVDQFVVMQVIEQASVQGRNGKGAVQLFSSGNENAGLIWPSNFFNNISVGATTNKDKRASFSNFGPALDISAPGVQIATTDMTGANGYNNGDYMLDFGGTSAACPNAAGVAALILSLYPDFTYTQVRALLRVSAERVGDYAYDSVTTWGNWGPQLGYGRINAFQALSMAPFLHITEADNGLAATVSLYPNPTGDVLVVLAEGFSASETELRMTDVHGKIIRIRKHYASQEGSLWVEEQVSDLPAGLYFLELRQANRTLCTKFVKQ